MVKKAIVLEIKDAYILAMEEGGAIVRLIRREPLVEGDAIYFLPEDLYAAKSPAQITPLPVGKTARRSRSIWMRVGSLAAVLLLFVLAFFPHGQATAYALVSLNGERSVELELSREGNILRAVSDSDAVSDEMLRSLLDHSLSDSADTLRQLCGGRLLFAAYTLLDGEEDGSLEALLTSLFGGDLICRRGAPEDLAAAQERQIPLVRYLFEDEEALRKAWEIEQDDDDDDDRNDDDGDRDDLDDDDGDRDDGDDRDRDDGDDGDDHDVDDDRDGYDDHDDGSDDDDGGDDGDDGDDDGDDGDDGGDDGDDGGDDDDDD